MKLFLAVASFFMVMGAAEANVNGLHSVTCKYNDKYGTLKRPVVTVSTTYHGNNYEPRIKLSVAYVRANGKKVTETAIVTQAGYTTNYEGFYVGATTSTGRYIDISIYVANGPGSAGFYDSYLAVNGNHQPHMNNLKCKFATAG